jgi:hypothetical protein
MGMPELVVTAVLVEGRSKSDVARNYGASRRWVITLVQRFLADGDVGLQLRSRRPLRGPARTADVLEDEIRATRKDLDRHGHEAGAATIAAHLIRRHGSAPAVSTIWRILIARGGFGADHDERRRGHVLLGSSLSVLQDQTLQAGAAATAHQLRMQRDLDVGVASLWRTR